MDEKAALSILTEVGAIVTNSHFVFTSGRHSNTYVNKDALYLHPTKTAQLCEIISRQYHAEEVDVVAGPTIGGVVISQWTAYHLNARRKSGETLSVYVEKEGEGADKKFILERGYDTRVVGKNVVVVEDVIMTGDSAAKVVNVIKQLGGNVLGLSVLCNRGGITSQDVGNTPIHALTNLTFEWWQASDCPLCQANVPINTSLGKGKQFLSKKRSSAAVQGL